jgi:molybdopterin-guanine dinucleotide biosynthesis protein B
MAPILAIIGTGRKSGKTTVVEFLLRGFTSRGWKVATIKQIHETGFSLDTPGKDTWRHAEAGARVVVSAAPGEVALIQRLREGEDRSQEALRLLEGEDLDLILVEGNPTLRVPLLLVARDPEGAERILEGLGEERKRVLFLLTLSPEAFEGSPRPFDLPVFHPGRDGEEILRRLEKAAGKG